MDVRLIEAYQAVMTYGTVSRAAEVLGMSQPGVSKAIMSLERSIGFKLFDRERGRMTPSAEGQLFFREVQTSLVGLAKLRSAAARIRDYGSGDIRVGCLSAFSTNVMPAAIARFRKRHPDIAVSLLVASSSAIRDLIAANQLDIAIAADEVDVSGLETAPFIEIPGALALPPGHPLASKAASRPRTSTGSISSRSLLKTPPARRRRPTSPNTAQPPRSCWKPPMPRWSAHTCWPAPAVASSIRLRPPAMLSVA